MEPSTQSVQNLRDILASWKGHKAPPEIAAQLAELEAALNAYDQDNDPASFRAMSRASRAKAGVSAAGVSAAGVSAAGVSPHFSSGEGFVTPEQRSSDFGRQAERGLVAAPIVGAAALTSGMWGGPLVRMAVEGTKSIPAIAGAGMLGAGSEMLEDKPTLLGALANAAQWAGAARLPLSEVLTSIPEAQAGPAKKMLQMMYRGRSSFTPIEERAMFMSPSQAYAEEYAKRRVSQLGGDRMIDSYLVDPFTVERRGHNITPEGGGNMQSIIAYPKTGEAEYKGTREFAKGGSVGELRDIIKQLRAKHAR